MCQVLFRTISKMNEIQSLPSSCSQSSEETDVLTGSSKTRQDIISKQKTVGDVIGAPRKAL